MVPVNVPDLPWLVKPIRISEGDCSHPYGGSLWLLVNALNIAGMLPKFGAFPQLAALQKRDSYVFPD